VRATSQIGAGQGSPTSSKQGKEDSFFQDQGLEASMDKKLQRMM
jgi:hypothetical protein